MSSQLPPPVLTGPSATPIPEPRRPRVDPILLAGVFAGVLMLLIGVVMVADLSVVTTTHQAEVTDKDSTARRKDGVRRETYSIRGVDDDGGTFRVGVDEDAYESVNVGDEVTVERSVLTGRVVTVEGRGWAKERSSLRLWIAIGLAVLGVAIGAAAWRTARREMRAAVAQGAPVEGAGMKVTAMVLAAVLATVVWVLIERVVAS